jgi:peptidoglycan/xylan/chitin deacetylase (PgdA/CDA1 family)
LGREENGRPILSRASLCRLVERGHEIGCHTYSHVAVQRLSAQAFEAETRANQSFMQSACGDIRLRSFAYPFGDASPARKRQVERLFAAGRGVMPGVNSGWADLGLLKSIPLYASRRDDAAVDAWLDEATQRRGWAIFHTHDVEEDPSSWGATVEQLERTVRKALDLGFEILPIRNAIGRLAFSRGLSA